MGRIRQMKREMSRRSIKAAEERSWQAQRQINEVPEKCASCSEKLDPKNKEHLDTWIIVHSKQGDTQLFCKACHERKKNA